MSEMRPALNCYLNEIFIIMLIADASEVETLKNALAEAKKGGGGMSRPPEA